MDDMTTYDSWKSGLFKNWDKGKVHKALPQFCAAYI